LDGRGDQPAAGTTETSAGRGLSCFPVALGFQVYLLAPGATAIDEDCRLSNQLLTELAFLHILVLGGAPFAEQPTGPTAFTVWAKPVSPGRPTVPADFLARLVQLHLPTHHQHRATHEMYPAELEQVLKVRTCSCEAATSQTIAGSLAASVTGNSGLGLALVGLPAEQLATGISEGRIRMARRSSCQSLLPRTDDQRDRPCQGQDYSQRQ